MIVFQSPSTVLRPCPSGTFENSQQHARVIYGWVHRPGLTQSPEGTAEIFLHVGRIKNRAAAHARSSFCSFCLNLCVLCDSVAKKIKFAKRTHFEKFGNPCKSTECTKKSSHFGAKTNPFSPASVGQRDKKTSKLQNEPNFPVM
jgi:hypothetical protein